jgi:formylglycine-generating enzyme required for sulfatase activity
MVAALLAAAGIIFWLLNRNPPAQRTTNSGASGSVSTVTPRRTLELDSGDMVLVDTGSALLGQDAKSTDVNAFYMDKTEVTNASYLKFCQQTAYAAPPSAQQGPADYPVVNVSFYDVEAYAHWAKKRLPTATEWEKAARGAKGQQFPWGNDWREDAANIPRDRDASKTASLAPASSFGSGASPYGAVNMVGNAWEWVNAPALLDDHQFEMLQKFWKVYSPPLSRTEAFYQIRGGSFHYVAMGPKADLVVDSLTMPARAREPDIGFRCARDP